MHASGKWCRIYSSSHYPQPCGPWVRYFTPTRDSDHPTRLQAVKLSDHLSLPVGTPKVQISIAPPTFPSHAFSPDLRSSRRAFGSRFASKFGHVKQTPNGQHLHCPPKAQQQSYVHFCHRNNNAKTFNSRNCEATRGWSATARSGQAGCRVPREADCKCRRAIGKQAKDVLGRQHRVGYGPSTCGSGFRNFRTCEDPGIKARACATISPPRLIPREDWGRSHGDHRPRLEPLSWRVRRFRRRMVKPNVDQTAGID
uniref:Uncharacterized protein n=1 Tax=Ananas comosus var. bracteatus TaxID=296719 RepID=A0A6V7NXQ7_ANACO|nr:unnamed protein product [Ananas comosus var. bracteatus]